MVETADTEKLADCPFCGEPMTIRTGPNGYGLCETEGCWMHERRIGVPLDTRQAAEWNRRAALRRVAEPVVEDRVARLEEALKKARDTFADYGRQHRAKLTDSTPTMEWQGIMKKAGRNEALVREMDAALEDTRDGN